MTLKPAIFIGGPWDGREGTLDTVCVRGFWVDPQDAERRIAYARECPARYDAESRVIYSFAGSHGLADVLAGTETYV